MLRKGGCAWWAVFIIAVLTFLVGFLWGTAASSRTAGSPVAVVVDVPAPVVATSPKAEPVELSKVEPQAPEPVKTDPDPKSVPVVDPPKVEIAPEPVNPIDQPKADLKSCDDIWASAAVVKLSSGATAILMDGGGCVISFSVESLVIGSGLMKPLKIVGGEEERLPVTTYASREAVSVSGNKFGVVDISGSGKRIAVGADYGDIMLVFSSHQKFDIGADKREFVRLYLEWIKLNPVGVNDPNKPINLLKWWGEVNADK